jgi:hypothetical protein
LLKIMVSVGFFKITLCLVLLPFSMFLVFIMCSE